MAVYGGMDVLSSGSCPGGQSAAARRRGGLFFVAHVVYPRWDVCRHDMERALGSVQSDGNGVYWDVCSRCPVFHFSFPDGEGVENVLGGFFVDEYSGFAMSVEYPSHCIQGWVVYRHATCLLEADDVSFGFFCMHEQVAQAGLYRLGTCVGYVGAAG